jgi:two-component system, NtrC family, sensor kinase
MHETYSMAPIWFTDVFGSASMVVLSFLSVMYARRLAQARPADVIWTYLLWLTLALAVFAVSRSVGHIAKRVLLLCDMGSVWLELRPYSGGLNTIAFVVVASITLFFHRVQRIHAAILDDRRALREVGQEVMRLNRDLESLVMQRTDELSRSESKYRRVFEGSMDMIFILDGRGRFVDINKAGLNTLGYGSTSELAGKQDLRSFFVSTDDYRQVVDDVVLHGFVRDRECRLKSRTGAELFVLLSATGGKDDEGRPIRYEGMAKDITARKHLERQLQQADKLASLGQISTGLAHEINNPLGVVLGYTQLLLRETESGTQMRDDLKTIEKHVRNCKTILDDLLKFARSTPTKKTSVDINECLAEVISLLAHQFELEKVLLQTALDPDLPRLVADAEKVKQVFMNLLMNAKQAIANSGRIVVETSRRQAQNCIRVAISDDGCGIAPELIHKIFDPFFTTKPVGEGTGLGLSVSYGIIQDHGGRIEVVSEPGKGSTFSVFLPLEEVPSAETSRDVKPAGDRHERGH